MPLDELTNWNEYTKLFIGLFALTPPPILIPLYLSIVANRPAAEQKRIALYGSLAFLITMLVFIFGGEALLELFGISISAFRIAGGILLLVIALDMMRSEVAEPAEEVVSPDRSSSVLGVSIVPLAIPFLAGPGTISTIIIYAQQHETAGHRLLVAGVALGVSVLVYGLFRVSLTTGRLFTPTVATVFNRVMGLIIAAIAIEFILHGVAGHFPGLEILH